MSKALESFVHLVELSNAGWRNQAVDLIVISKILELGGQCAPTDLGETLLAQLPVGASLGDIDQYLSRLVAKGTIQRLTGDQVKLSEESKKQFTAHIESHNRLEAEAEALFKRHVDAIAPELELGWQSFRDDFLKPLTMTLGARTFEFLSGVAPLPQDADAFVRYVNCVPEKHRARASQIIESFLDPKNEVVRSYLLRLLNAVLLVHSTALSASALSHLEERTKKRLRLRVFVDTNFLFSLIGLHENPADDLVDVLRRVITETSHKLDVHFYVLPHTVDEARRTILNYADKLSGINVGRVVGKAVLQRTTDLSGIALKFIRDASTSKLGISSSDYFKPYIENLVTICRSRGVELYNEPSGDLSTNQDVIDDVLDQQRFLKAHPERRQKSYESIVHDVVIWHFTARKRPKALESHLDAEHWVATIDFGLLGFDRYKLRRLNNQVPVCLHPSVLLRILQLWIPRSDVLDAALVDSFRPLVPHTFDRESEAVTLRVLRGLSRFRDVGDLGEDAITRIMFDNAVRARIVDTGGVQEEIEVIGVAIAEELKQQREALVSERTANQRLSEELAARSAEVASLQQAARLSLAAQEQQRRESEHATAAADERAAGLQRRLEALEASATARLDQERDKAANLKFLLLTVVVLAGYALLLSVGWVLGGAMWISASTTGTTGRVIRWGVLGTVVLWAISATVISCWKQTKPEGCARLADRAVYVRDKLQWALLAGAGALVLEFVNRELAG